MRFPGVGCLPVRHRLLSTVVFSIVAILGLALPVWGQGTYTAQLRGVVRDKSGAMVAGAKLVVTEDDTNVSHPATSDGAGQYIFVSLRPSTYTLRVDAAGFEPAVNRSIVLAVNQQAELNFILKPAVSTITVDVVDTAPLLDSGGASLGTEVTNEFISRIPLFDRDVTQLVYLSAGVTELNNTTGYPAGTAFSSNGQRYGSAEIRLDGALATGPEQGEGSTTNLSYLPSGEVIQEFKVQNNSFAAEFGSNGGTVVNVLMKSGTNKFHGSGWWFGQRTALNANDFFSNRFGVPRTDSTRDQYGFSIAGPIVKGKTFFLFDLERVRQNQKSLVSARVPTMLERGGDFSQTMTYDNNGNLVPVQLFNPFDIDPITQERKPLTGNVIPPGLINSIGQKMVNAYPMPTGDVDPNTLTNFNKGVVVTEPSTQFDVKIDHELTSRMHLMGRYSQNGSTYDVPGLFYDGIHSKTTTRNVALEYTWALSPQLFWTNRLGLDRYYQKGASDPVDPTQLLGLPSLFKQANNISRMPYTVVDGFNTLNPQCCVDTINGHTQYVYSSSMDWVHGKHVLKFGGEQRPFFNNFYQPDYATGLFNFGRGITAPDPFNPDLPQYGSGLAGMFLGFATSGQLNIKYPVANKSTQTAFYIQDDWKVLPRLTLNLGLRYEWSIPYTERYNRIQFSDFKGDTGVTVDLSSGQPDLQALGLGPTRLQGTTVFASSNNRHIPIAWNNWGPRLGFAYQLGNNTVARGGFGVFFGLSSATNFQYSGTAFRKDAAIHFTLDGGLTQYATLDNPFPTLPPNTAPQPQGQTYGKLADWGFANNNDLAAGADHNPHIYQWNLGLQRLFPMGIVISADYSANRSTHLPWGGATRNRDFLPAAIRQQLVDSLNPTHDPTNSLVSAKLASLVTNPFLPMFQGPGAIFNEPDSQYNNAQIPLANLLNPYPQFDGDFEGSPLLTASSWYNALLVRFQKRPSHGLSFEGNYTWSKATDYSSYGANYWIYFLGSGLGNPQDLNNLKAEHSLGANDTPQRFVLAAVYDLPVGRKRSIGANLNRLLDAVVGGWSVNSLLTFQSGPPIPFAESNQRLAGGTQRPNLTCSHPLSGMSLHDIASSGGNYFNSNCFSDPGDQIPGNAPRFSGNARGQGIRNLDLGLFKSFAIREDKKLELRAEFFNFTNSVRFATPFSSFGDPAFGLVAGQQNSPRRVQVAVRFEF
jgi:Carboxypeptidase regulatory-like domain/TonB dependent receptor